MPIQPTRVSAALEPLLTAIRLRIADEGAGGTLDGAGTLRE